MVAALQLGMKVAALHPFLYNVMSNPKLYRKGCKAATFIPSCKAATIVNKQLYSILKDSSTIGVRTVYYVDNRCYKTLQIANRYQAFQHCCVEKVKTAD